MSKQTFGFQEQLNIGNKGEKDFLRYFKELEPKKSEAREVDFILKNGKTCELKSDSYLMEETPNYFMEMFSNTESGSLGGPFRAAQDNVDYFIYYFPKNKVFHWFETQKLCKLVEEKILILKLKPKNIRNKGWTTSGYCVPRSELESILIRKDVF